MQAMKDRGQLGESANVGMYTKLERTNVTNFRDSPPRAQNATTEMNKSAPKKFNKSVNGDKSIPDFKGLKQFYKERVPSATKRVSLSNMGVNEQTNSPMTKLKSNMEVNNI